MVGFPPARGTVRRLSCPHPPRRNSILVHAHNIILDARWLVCPGDSGRVDRRRRIPSAGEYTIPSILAFARLPHHVLVLAAPYYKDKAYKERSTQPDRANSNTSRCGRDPPCATASLETVLSLTEEKVICAEEICPSPPDPQSITDQLRNGQFDPKLNSQKADRRRDGSTFSLREPVPYIVHVRLGDSHEGDYPFPSFPRNAACFS